MNTRITLALVAMALLAGWIIGGERNPVQAQMADASQQSHCWEIPWDVQEAGGHFLLNKCTGDTWHFDDGHEGSAFAGNLERVRPMNWQRVARR